jgi:hypothetical protein
MKTFAPPTPVKKALAISLVIISSLASARAGFFEILRGDPAAATSVAATPSYQKVAFVGSASVKEVQGQAERLESLDHWKPLQQGAKLAPGDILRTRNGTVVLRMAESGSFVKMTPHTILRLTQLDNGWDRAALSGCEEKRGFVVRSCRGKAYVRDASGEWQNIAVNCVLAAGSEIRTEPETVIDLFNTENRRPLRIRGSNLLRLHENAFANRVLAEPKLVAASHP